MVKTTTRLFLLVIGLAIMETAVAVTIDPVNRPKTEKSDSLTVKNKQIISGKEKKAQKPALSEKNLSFWSDEDEIEEDSTSNSALSFNFIYYLIEKFKFQVE